MDRLWASIRRAVRTKGVTVGMERIALRAFREHNLGVRLQDEGDIPGAVAAYRAAIETGHPEYAPSAQFNLGVLLEEEGDIPSAVAAFRAVISSGHPEYGRMAQPQ